jgi:hypothetical protein
MRIFRIRADSCFIRGYCCREGSWSKKIRSPPGPIETTIGNDPFFVLVLPFKGDLNPANNVVGDIEIDVDDLLRDPRALGLENGEDTLFDCRTQEHETFRGAVRGREVPTGQQLIDIDLAKSELVRLTQDRFNDVAHLA